MFKSFTLINGCILFFVLIMNFSFAQRNVFDISRNGTLDELKGVYQDNPDVINLIDERGFSSLILACYHGNREVANFLIEHVSDINYKSDDGTALMAAVVKNELELVENLLIIGADPNLTDVNDTTALHYAVLFNQLDTIKLLVENDAKANIKNNNNQTAYDFAKINNNEKLIEILKKAML